MIGKLTFAAVVSGGVPAHAITKRPYRAPEGSTEAPIRLAYATLVAEVPHRCGHWPEQAWSDEKNAPYWNFGCAYQANMAAMVAEPTDFITPRGMDEADNTRRGAVIEAYRAAKATKSETGLAAAKSSQANGGE